ncbi:MAG: CHAT domain-containing protein [Gammaproteobacteria bacterium]|nr:CHAT domain-containing protein [Gammaproteobacteria bacterium]NNF60157.1 CHAT domain-containing protein [Gammaproteobacteria bacterium]NNM21569.1 CHAT domain-containing protein [Gammaproteobacteria bacterium]
MKYHDFRIRIEAKRDDGYDVSVESPAGSADEHIVLPFDVEEAINQLHNMGRAVRGSGATQRKVVMEGPEPVKPSEFGAQLFNALFTGRVGKLYNAMSRDLQDPSVGLRINLHLNLNDAGVGKLAGVPWEYVYDADTMDYLNLSKQTPIVRYLDVQRPNTLQPLAGKLKVLVVMSSPKGEHQLDLAKERQLIESIWGDDDDVELTVKEHPTPNALRQWLTSDDYHVLHYMGHGTHDESTGVGALVLEDEEQNAKLLDAETLGTFLRNAPTVRLAFLNACDLAKTDEDSPFSGVANRLVMAGLPAVVAMQFPISDEAAIAFARTFYSRLERGVAVDEAVAHGRNAILADQPGSMEWGTPVLYMRTPDGRLFDKGEDPADAEPVAVTPAPATGAVAGTDGIPKSNITAIAGGAGVLALIAAAAVYFLLGTRAAPLDFESREVEAYINEPLTLRFGPTSPPEDSSHLDRYDVVVSAPNANDLSVGETQEVDGFWRAELTASAAGEFEVMATVTDTNKPEAEPRNKAAKVNVIVSPTVESAFSEAVNGVENEQTSTAAAIEALTGVEALGLSAQMREQLLALKQPLTALSESRQAADAAFDSGSATLTDKISAYEAWISDFSAARNFEPAPELPYVTEALGRLEQLQGRMNVAGFSVCQAAAPCSGETSFGAGSRVYSVVEHTEAEQGSGVAVLFFLESDPPKMVKERKFSLQGNTRTSDWTILSQPGSYTARLYNSNGDLLRQQALKVN